MTDTSKPPTEVAALRATVDELHRRLDLADLHLRSLADVMREWLHGFDLHEREMMRRERIAKSGDR